MISYPSNVFMLRKSADFMNNSGYLCYSRVEVAGDARRRHMKLWSSTAIGPQQSRCSEIGSPVGEKMPTEDVQLSFKGFYA